MAKQAFVRTRSWPTWPTWSSWSCRTCSPEHGYHDVPIVRVSGLRALEGDPRWTASIEELLQVVDDHVPIPVRYIDAPFLLPVENVFSVTGRGTVVTGAIERGTVKIGDTVQAVGLGDTTADGFTAVVTGVETLPQPIRWWLSTRRAGSE